MVLLISLSLYVAYISVVLSNPTSTPHKIDCHLTLRIPAALSVLLLMQDNGLTAGEILLTLKSRRPPHRNEDKLSGFTHGPLRPADPACSGS
jgi:hypothetical protein